MTVENKRIALQNRIDKLRARGDKNIKSGGVLRKLKRKLIKLEN